MNEEVRKFLLSLIELEVWGQAVWQGCFFIFDEGQPPIMMFMFQHKKAGQEIFAGLRALVGPDDEESLLRISIIEGRFEGNDNAYAVNVGPNHINIRRHFGLSDDATGERYLFNRNFLRISPRTLEHLNNFKRLYRRFGVYKLMPAVISANSLTPFDELGILKHDLILRKQSDIRPDDDEDALALDEG